MNVPEGLKSALWPVGVALGLALLGFLARHVMVSRFVTPQVVNQLEAQGHLRPAIKEGRFVTTDLREFADNHQVSSAVLLDLKTGGYLGQDHLDETVSPIGERGDDNAQRIAELESRVAALQAAIDRTTRVMEAERKGGFEVILYISDLEVDRGFLVLNRQNPLVGHFLTNGNRYQVSAGGNQPQAFQVRIEHTPAPDQPKDAPIGRMHREDYHALFDGVGHTIGRATVHVH